MTPGRLGFAGLGQMGGPMAANIAKGGFALAVYDKAGTRERTPDKASSVDSLESLAAQVETLFLSLPDGPATVGFARDLAAVKTRAVKVVIDLSTIGIEDPRDADRRYTDAGLL